MSISRRKYRERVEDTYGEALQVESKASWLKEERRSDTCEV